MRQRQRTAAATIPWVEKYRPSTIDSVVSQDMVLAALRTVLSSPNPNLPHLLLHGPPGTGKTTTALALARQLFGPDHLATRVRELNASDDRGIQAVREKVKSFAQIAVGARPGVQSDGKSYPCPAFKIIILDEADALLHDAQTALRRTIEDFSALTRFCFVCNYASKIIDPIASRCAKFRFAPVPPAAICARLRHVADAEGVAVGDAALGEIAALAGGDLRCAVNVLHSAVRMFGGALDGVAYEDLFGVVPAARAQVLWGAVCSGSFDACSAAVTSLVADGYGGGDILSAIASQVRAAGPGQLTDVGRALAFVRLSSAERRLSDGADDHLQVLDVCAYIQQLAAAGAA